MDAGTKFGRGPRELGGSVDLIKQCKIWPHHEFFCKKPLPIKLSETRYLHNVIGKTEIEKGEGMELDQLLQNALNVENRHLDLHPFDMEILREAFKMGETTHVDLSYAQKGTATKNFKLNGDTEDNKNHKKHKIRDKDKSKGYKRRHHQDSSIRKDDGKTSNGRHDIDPDNLQELQDKKRKVEGVDDLSSIQIRQKTKFLRDSTYAREEFNFGSITG